jgi:hypothetical protein
MAYATLSPNGGNGEYTVNGDVPAFSNLPLSGPVRTIQAKSDLIVFEQSNYQGRQCLVECPPGSTVTVDITSLPVNFSAGSLAYVRP